MSMLVIKIFITVEKTRFIKEPQQKNGNLSEVLLLHCCAHEVNTTMQYPTNTICNLWWTRKYVFAPTTIHFLFLWTGKKMTNLSFTSLIWFQLKPQGELSACLFQLPPREQQRNIWPIKNNGPIHFRTGLKGTPCFHLQLPGSFGSLITFYQCVHNQFKPIVGDN